MIIRSLLVLSSLALALPAHAAPPALTSLFPPGAGQGQTVELTATGTFARWPVRAWVEGKGVEMRPAKTKGKFTVTVAPDAVPGPRWLRLHDEQGASSLFRFVVGALHEVNEREPNDDYRKPHLLPAPNVTVNGRLAKAGDVDCFGVQLRKGQTFVASVDAQRTLASPMDAVLQIVSDRGIVLAQNNDHHGLDPQVVFPVPSDGAYVVRLFAFPAIPDASIRFAGGERFLYRLTLTTGAFADHAFPLAVERGRPATVELVGWNLSASARKALTIAPEGEPALLRAFGKDVAGTADVRVEPHPTTVHFRPGDSKKQMAITLPVTVTGRLERRDEAHVYQFTARKGQRLVFQVESPSLGFPVDPVLRVRNAAGKVVAEAQPPRRALSKDVETGLVVPADGTYRVEVRDLNGDGGPRYLYRLRALSAQPALALSVARDQFTLTAGKPIDIPVTVSYRAGFKGEVVLGVEGLPPGVRAEMLKDRVRLSADAGLSWVGAIRIVGRGKEKPEEICTARVAVKELGTTAPHLWLNVVGAKK